MNSILLKIAARTDTEFILRYLVVAIAIFGYFGVMGPAVQACSCFGPGTPCESYGAASAVFAGTAISVRRAVEPKPGPVQPINYERIFKFAVDQSYLGVAGTEVEISTGSGGGDCGYNFRIGERYLVYAHSYGDRLATGICTRTKPFANANEDLTFLGNLSSAPSGATIYGQLVRGNPSQNDSTSFPSGIIVTIDGSSGKREIRVDAQGRYRVAGLPAGKFKVTLKLPDDTLFTARLEQEINVADRGCASVPYYVEDNGRLSGRVIDAEGQPVAGITLTLIEPASDPKKDFVKMERTDKEGRFYLSAVPAGRYLIAINQHRFRDPKDSTLAYPPVFYPGVVDRANAEVIMVGAGEKLTGLDVRVPLRRPESTVTVEVVWAHDGSPVANASLSMNDITDAETSISYGAQADDQGKFTINGYIGQKLLLDAQSPHPYNEGHQPAERSAKVRVTLSRSQETVKVVITKIR